MVNWQLHWCMIVAAFLCVNGAIESCRFTTRPICADHIVPLQYVYQHLTVRSLTDCLRHCTDQTSCASVNYRKPDCQLTNITLTVSCEPYYVRPGWKNYASCLGSCKNGGYMANGSCICNGGYYGVTCEKIVTDCIHASTIPFYQNQRTLMLIKPVLASQPFYVLCEDIYGRPRTYIQMRTNNQTNFYRSWQEYKWGFGNMTIGWSNDFWLGNEKIYLLTNSRSFKLMVEMSSEGWGLVYKAIYTQFYLSPEDQEYKMHYNSYEQPTEYLTGGALGDSLYFNLNERFSTFDQDYSGGCPNQFHSGWWFKGGPCTYANPNGILVSTPVRLGINAEVFWTYNLQTWSPKIVQIWLEAP